MFQPYLTIVWLIASIESDYGLVVTQFIAT